MIYTELTKKAMRISLNAHQGQTDRSGMPYFLHPFHVADQMESEEETCVALLHDVVEDTDVTLEDLRLAGMPAVVLEAVDLLTHRRNEPYMDYVRKLSVNRMAKTVKLRDLEHNLDLGRIDHVTKEDLRRTEKYRKAQAFLLERSQA